MKNYVSSRSINIPQKIDANIAVYFLGLLLMLMGLSFPLFSLLSFGIFGLYLIIKDIKSAYYLLFFLLPFANIFKYSTSSSSMFTYLELILALEVIINIKKIPQKTFATMICLIMIQILGCKMEVTVFLKQACILPLICGVMMFDLDTVKVVKHFSFGLFFSSLCATFSDFIPGLDMYLKEIKVFEISLDALRFTGLYSDPNFYSSAIILASAGLITLMYQKAIKKTWIIMVLLLLEYGIQTVSKSFFLMLIVIAVIITAICLKSRKYKMVFTLFGLTAVLVILIMTNVVNIFDNVISRIVLGDFTTGRDNIWMMYIEEILKNPVKIPFGYGIGEPLLFGKAAHNSYIDLIFYYGVVGSFLWFGFIKSVLPKNKIKLLSIESVPFLSFLIMSFFLSYIVMFDLPFLIIYILLLAKSGQKKEIGAVKVA